MKPHILAAVEEVLALNGLREALNEVEHFEDAPEYVTAHRLDDMWKHLQLPQLDSLDVLGAGRGRMVLGSDVAVYKVPLSADGLEANRREAHLCQVAKDPKRRDLLDGVEVAACGLRDPFLVMERVEPHAAAVLDDVNEATEEYDDLPRWVRKLEDGPQVGRTRTGRIVSFDFGEQPLVKRHGKSSEVLWDRKDWP